MTGHFLQAQLDYIYFLVGLTFILTAAICATIRQQRLPRLPWLWLGLFGISQGIYQWLNMLGLLFGSNNAFDLIRLTLLAISFLLLTEFGRSGLVQLRAGGPSRWVYLPLSIGLVAAGLIGNAVLDFTLRFLLGPVSGLGTALVLFQAARNEKTVRNYFNLAGLAILIYQVLGATCGPWAAYFPAILINQDSFLAVTGIPAQVVQGSGAILLTLALWLYYQHSLRPSLVSHRMLTGKHYGLYFYLILTLIINAGWVFTDYAGRNADQEIRRDILGETELTGAALSANRIKRLSLSGTAAAGHDYQRLRRQLLKMNQVHQRFSRMYLIMIQNGRMTVMVDSSSPAELAPAAAAVPFRQAPPELAAVFSSGYTAITGPDLTKSGAVISSFAPLLDPLTGKVLAVLGGDLTAAAWQHKVELARMVPISMTLLVALLFIISFIDRQRLWEAGQLLAVHKSELEEAQQVAHIGSWTLDPSANQIFWSEEMYRIFGRDPQHGPYGPSDYQSLFDPDHWLQTEKVLQQSLTTVGNYQTEVRLNRPDGARRELLIRLSSRGGPNGMVTQVVGTVQDITEQKVAEAEIRQLNEELEQRVKSRTAELEQALFAQRMLSEAVHHERNRLQQYLDIVGVFLMVLTPDGEVRMINRYGLKVLGVSEAEIVGQNWFDKFTNPEEREDLRRNFQQWISGQAMPEELTAHIYQIQIKDGSERIISWQNTLIRDQQGRVIGSLSSGEDVTEQVRAEQRLREMSLIDDLTGINNRRGFLTLAEQQLKIADRFQQKLALIYADLDDLKSINDCFGHQAGDQALQETAQLLKNTFRVSDIIARIGGDEFVGLALESTELSGKAIIERLQESLNARNREPDRPYQLTISFGLARYNPKRPCSLAKLMEQGDQLMYQQKKQKKPKQPRDSKP